MSTPEVREPAGDDAEEEEDNELMDVEDFEEMTAPETQKRNKLDVIKNALRSVKKKLRLTDRRLAQLSNYAEYLMVGFITLAILVFIAGSIHFIFVGTALPFMVYMQAFFGSIFAAIGMFALQIIFEGGTDYLATVNRRR